MGSDMFHCVQKISGILGDCTTQYSGDYNCPIGESHRIPINQPVNGGFLSHGGYPQSSSISNDGIVHELKHRAITIYGNLQMFHWLEKKLK